MIKKVLLALALVGVTGCGHNVINYSDGIGFDAGINPENCTFAFNLRYGKILTAVVRDNAEIELDSAVNTDVEKGADLANKDKLRMKIGRQINGYTVDLVEAGCNPDKLIKTIEEKPPK